MGGASWSAVRRRLLGLAAVAVASACAACSADDTTLRLDLPVASVHHAAIIAAWLPAEPSRVVTFVREVRDDLTMAPIALPFERAAGLSLAAALYAASLDELFLSEGTVSLETADPGRPAPSTVELFEAGVTDGGATAWTQVPVAPVGLAAARLPSLDDCVALSSEAFRLADTRSPYFALGVRVASPPPGLTGHGVLVGYQDRRVFYVEGETSRELTPTIPGPCGNDTQARALYYDGYQEPEGSVWLAGRCGELHRVTIDLEGARLDGGPARAMVRRDSIHAVAGPRRGPVAVIHALSELGELDRVSVTSGATLVDDEGRRGEGGLVHLADDEAALVWTPAPEVVRVRGEAVTRELPPVADPATTELRHLAATAQLGLVTGDSTGAVYYERGTRWRALGAPFAAPIRALVPHGESVVVLDGDAALHLHAPARGTYCPSFALPGPADSWHHVAVTEGAMLVTGDAGTYLWITER